MMIPMQAGGLDCRIHGESDAQDHGKCHSADGHGHLTARADALEDVRAIGVGAEQVALQTPGAKQFAVFIHGIVLEGAGEDLRRALHLGRRI